MTKKLEELFDLEDEDNSVDEQPKEALTITQLNTTLDSVSKIDAALPTVRDLETTDAELDDIAETARQTFQDLMDLGMNVEARFAGEIFNNASRMLDTALTAKTNKVNKKLKMVDLQIKKATLDLKNKQNAPDTPADGQGMVVDRNTLLNEILGKNV
jgi:hypothetical protein|tara:strand:+ start:246 stop:716 length:471 start_codon:yes stop_codon:yes gene_type:complete